MDGASDLRLRAGDRVALAGCHEILVGDKNLLVGYEVNDRELLDIPVLTLDVIVTSKAVAGRALGDLGSARAVFLRKLVRAGAELPFTPRTIVDRGDVLTIVGAKLEVERVASNFGYADRPTSAIDMVTVGGAIVLGGLIGLPALALGKL